MRTARAMMPNRSEGDCSRPFSILCLILLFMPLAVPLPCHAQEFTAITLGNFGNVAVMEVTGTYDALNPDGSLNRGPRQAIAREFFRTHEDNYDFLVIYTNFDFKMPEAEARAFYQEVRNDVEGIGRPIFDNSGSYGSQGKLQGMIDMGNLSGSSLVPLDPSFEESLFILGHETMHRWGAYVKFKETDGTLSDALLHLDLQKHAAHWSFLLDSRGSVLYGNEWQDNSNGTFTSVGARSTYSPLDLYLMGLYDKSQVPSMLLIVNPEIQPQRPSQTGVTIPGTARYVTIDDIIAAEGERTPGPSTSQKDFKTGLILVLRPESYTAEELNERYLPGIENVREGWMTRFSILTDGQALMQIAATPKPELPSNPGTEPPDDPPRTLPPNIDDGVAWLMNHQDASGSWMDSYRTAHRETTEALLSLKSFPSAAQNYALALDWLMQTKATNTVYQAKRIEALADAGANVATPVADLTSARNEDGGWGIRKGYRSSSLDTASALRALASAGQTAAAAISPAVDYLKSKQHPDGGWGPENGKSTIEATTNVLYAFNEYRTTFQLEDQISRATEWLAGKQNADGGFGASPSTVYETAMAVSVLKELNVLPQSISSGVDYIMGRQSGNGSWLGSAYQTAVAVRTVWNATVDPDLSIVSSDISFTPPAVTSLPTPVAITATIWNKGRTSVPAAKVALYDGAPSLGRKVGEQVLAFPGQSSTVAAFGAVITDGEEHRFTIVIDEDNLVREPNKLNNSAFNILRPATTYDLEVLASGISFSPNPADVLKEVKITSMIANKGTMNAYNVQLKVYVDTAGSPIDIAIVTVDVPANGSVTSEVIWEPGKAGENLPVTVWVDPSNAFAEISEDNNKASAPLTVKGSTLPNLTVSHENITITPSPALEGGSALISARIQNAGFSAANNVLVNFYNGAPDVDGVLIGAQTIPVLNAGQGQTVSMNWSNIGVSGERVIYVEVDPNDQIAEINKDDNDAFTTIAIHSLPDLSVTSGSMVFTPAAPKEGDPVQISVTVQNLGEQPAANVAVRVTEGGTVIGSKVIPLIFGKSLSTASFAYAAGAKGPHVITATVDPENAIVEGREDNNGASRAFGIQNADLWLTEPYISPNGDGIKDSTRFFFRLAAPQNVTLAVMDEKGQPVRTLTGTAYQNTTGGDFLWEGLDDEGKVVPDGTYSIQVAGAGGNILGSLPVVVDNNRSALGKAAGTSYLLDLFLMPYSWIQGGGWSWLPDESGILSSYRANDPNHRGLYVTTFRGDTFDITQGQLLGKNWVSMPGDWPSPAGDKVAYILYEGIYEGGIYPKKLWFADTDGSGPKLVDPSYEYVKVGWAPDGSSIYYLAYRGTSLVPMELKTVNRDGTGKRTITQEAHCTTNYAQDTTKWVVKVSPDGSKIAYHYIIEELRGQCTKVFKLIVSDTQGNRRILYESLSNSYYPNARYLEWSSNDKLLFGVETGAANYKLLSFDVNGSSDPITLNYNNKTPAIIELLKDEMVLLNYREYIGGNEAVLLVDISGNAERSMLWNLPPRFTPTIVISPDRNNFAFKEVPIWEYIEGFTERLHVYSGGNVYTHEAPPGHGISGLAWSPDSSLLALAEGGKPSCVDPKYPYWYDLSIACPGWEGSANLVLINPKTGEETVVPLFPDLGHPELADFIRWLSDGVSIVAQKYPNRRYNYSPNRISAINSRTGEVATLVRSSVLDSPLSPNENYLAYTNYSNIRVLRSLMNLTADLTATKSQSAVILKGLAQDLNFQEYVLEYADARTPTQWVPMGFPSTTPVVNDTFTTWVPPYEGTFTVKLTVSDKAGNVKWDRKRVSWGSASSITNLYKTEEIFSPNGDGVKDTVELHYTVVDPVHLEFGVYNDQGALVRSFVKDHAASGADHISWDGRNESGGIVPDGTYKIGVFDYAFHVRVDNTPPDVGLALSRIKQSNSRKLFVEMQGFALDDKLKSWLVEYGEGYNPAAWYEYWKGTDTLGQRDASGQPVLKPFITVVDSDMERLVGKRFKITAEDYAGNRSSVIAGFLPEELVFYLWDNEPLRIDPGFIVNKQRPVSVGIRETVREQIARLTVQYSMNGGSDWSDAVFMDSPPSGEAGIPWDTSQLPRDPYIPYLVRVKAVDVLGNVLLSNEARMNAFELSVSCKGLKAFNGIEGLSLLSIQARSGHDPAYAQWQDVATYSPAQGTITVGAFLVYFAGFQPKQGIIYSIRMLGSGAGGETYESLAVSYPHTLCPEVSLSISYTQAPGCNQQAPGEAVLTAVTKGSSAPSVTERRVTFIYEDTNGQGQVLDTLVMTPGSPEAVTRLDINPFAEGAYPVKVMLEVDHVENNRKKTIKAEDSGELLVDRVLPSARITYPAPSLSVCPVQGGNRYVIPVEGQATDNKGVKGYELYYGYSRTAVKGSTSVEGTIGNWDVTGLKDPAPVLTLKVFDVSGNLSCHTTTFSFGSVPEVTSVSVSQSPFSPLSGPVTATYVIARSALVDVKVFKANKTTGGAYTLDASPLRTIVSGRQHLGGQGSAPWDGRNDAGSVVDDGKYGIAVFAKDPCGNTAQKWVLVEVRRTGYDTTPPDVTLLTPKESELYGSSRGTVNISGSIVEEHLESYVLRFGSGDNPATWTTLLTGTAPPASSQLFAWNVGKNSGVPDGLYTISLRARDESNQEGEARVRITVDNTAPQASITSPAEGASIKGPLDVHGTADDPALDRYTVEYSQGGCASANRWAAIGSGRTSVNNGVLAAWTNLPADGEYCLRLTVLDKLANSKEAKINIRMSVHPPSAPVLSGAMVNKTDASLTWTQNTEPNLQGYNLYRDGHKINSQPLTANGTLDRNLTDGSHAYTVKAVDSAGMESSPSNEVKIKVDNTPPEVSIGVPKEGSRVGGLVAIKGTAFSLDDFKGYRVFIAPGPNPSAWTLVRTSPIPVASGVLGDWDTLGLADQSYIIKVEAEDLSGNMSSRQVTVTLDNTAPARPVLVSATPNGADVTATWQANTDADLSGYLLYRNDHLANAAGTVVGDLKGFLISGTTYLDKALPDGKYRYYLAAMDQAGNVSDPSNAIEVTVDTRAPKATITQPAAASKFQFKTLVKAESTDTDIASVQFQYKRAQDSVWINLGAAVSTLPYVAYLDPAALGLTYGNYNLRAVAKDRGGKTDASPASITVTYTDITPPATPTGLKTLTNGSNVAISWNANSETDLSGYNLYRTTSGTRTKVNSAVLSSPAYQQSSLSSSLHSYDVTAVDTYGNESKPSAGVAARVYAPQLLQPTSPTGLNVISVSGISAEPNSTVAVSLLDPPNSVVQTTSDSSGNFSAGMTLVPGTNRMSARATDAAGNISNSSNVVSVTYDAPPSAPTGLSASVDQSAVNLGWNPNSETDLAGYNVYRNGTKIQSKISSVACADGNVPNGSHTYTVTAVDNFGNESPPSNPAVAMVHVEPLQAPVNLSVAAPPQGKSLQASWGYTGGSEAGFNLYRSTTSGGPYARANTSLIKQKSFVDTGLTNGVTYFYVVVAVDAAGNESPYSNEAAATPKDSIIQKPVILLPTQSGAPLTLYEPQTNVSGSAETMATVELFRDGGSMGVTTAVETEYFESFALGSGISGASLSPDGKTIAYAANDPATGLSAIWLKVLATGETTRIVGECGSPLWSPDGKQLACIVGGHINLYDLETEILSRLTDDDPVVEASPSWSADGTKVAFISNRGGYQDVWLKDLSTGVLTQMTDQGIVTLAKLSPDGTRVACIKNGNMYMVDLSGWSHSWTASNISFAWSPDGKKFAYAGGNSSNSWIYVVNIPSLNTVAYMGSSQLKSNLVWSPDGLNLLFSRDEPNGSKSLWWMPSQTLTGGEMLDQNLNNLIYLTWAPSGNIAYVNGSELRISRIGGYFTFTDVPLDPGENRFVATASDASGNMSEPSDEISVVFDTNLVPDLHVTPESILVYPACPTPGDDLAIFVDVENKGQMDATDVAVDVYLTLPSGERYLLGSTNIPTVGAGSTASVGTTWNHTGIPGQYTVTVVVDPLNEVEEATKSNNSASREILVSDNQGIVFASILDSEQYRVHEDVGIQLTVANRGSAMSGYLDVWVEDLNGYPVALAGTQPVDLAYGSEETVILSWNTGLTYAGEYRVHSVVKNGTGVLAEVFSPFTILPFGDIVCTVVTDKARYGSGEEVTIFATVENIGANYLIPDLTAKIRVLDGSGAELSKRDEPIVNLFPGTVAALYSTWNTAMNLPGDFRAVIEVTLDPDSLCGSAASFKIDADSDVTGNVAVVPSAVILGNQARVDYSVHNRGNAEVRGLVVKILVTDPETRDVMGSHEESVNLGLNGSSSGQFVFSTAGYAVKTYSVVLKSDPNSLAKTSLTVLDAKPPVLSNLSPTSNSFVSAAVLLAASASDDASGVESVEYRIDSGQWGSLPMADVSSGRYGMVWNWKPSEEGAHTIAFRARDGAQNLSDPVTTNITVDLTPPAILVDGVEDGQNYKTGVTPIVSVVEAHLDELQITLNGNPFLSGTPIQKQGSYLLLVDATDKAGNRATRAVGFTISLSSPPVADAGKDRNVTTGQLVTLDGSGSHDPEGLPITYLWTFIEVPAGSSVKNTSLSDRTDPRATFTPDVDGSYRLSLVVNNGNVDSAPDVVAFNAATPNVAPNAEAGPAQNAIVGVEVHLDGSKSWDPDHGPLPLTYLWTFSVIPLQSTLKDEDILNGDTANASFVPDVKGAYDIQLEVSDGDLESSDTVTVTAHEPNVPPNAHAGQDQTVELGKEVTLDGSASNDPDGWPQPLSFKWTFVSVPQKSALTSANIKNAETTSPSFKPDVSGSYVVQLQVYDGENRSSDTVVIVVKEGRVDVTGSVQMKISGTKSTLDRKTRQVTGTATVTVTNISKSNITGPIHAVFLISAAGVDMPEATGVDSEGHFYYDITGKLKGQVLPPRGSVKFNIKFKCTNTVRFSYQIRVYRIVK